MHENFIALHPAKRDRIINAATEEFSAKGFKAASTNEIVKRAAISKGALFHYFESKFDLFCFIYKYNMQNYLDIVNPVFENLPSDVMERWQKIAIVKLELTAQNPKIFEFMLNSFRDEHPEVQKYLKSGRTDLILEYSQKIHSGIDKSRFKEAVDIPKALEIIWWTLEGFAMKAQKTFDISKIHDKEQMSKMLAEFDIYIEMLKQTFYKEEYL